MRTMMPRNLLWMLCGFFLFILGVLYFWQDSLLSQCRARLDLALDFQASQIEDLSSIEANALSRWAAKNDVGMERALQGRRAFSASKGDEVCVVLALEPGAFGTSPMYCYDRRGNLVSEYSETE